MTKTDNKGITVKKAENFSEWYSQVIQKAKLADIRVGVQGFLVHRPWGFRIMRRVYEYLEEEFEKTEHEPMLFPIAVKEESLMKEEEHAGFSPEVFWVTHAGTRKLEERFALRPTGETQIYPVYSKWFRSYNELPFKAYQSRHTVFRNEMTTRPFLRGREFAFFESHNVFSTHKECLAQIDEDMDILNKVVKDKCKIPFFYFQRPQWDKFKGADNTFTPDTLMPDGKRNQLASTHDLGQNFSKAYDIQITDKKEKQQYAWQTCFGPGIWRIMAAIIGIHGDDNGLILPFDMAPKQIVLIPIFFKEKAEQNKVSKLLNKTKNDLTKKGYRVIIDDSENSPGFKFNHWELFGVPLRIEIGPRELKDNKATIVRRTSRDKTVINIKDLDKSIEKEAKKLDEDITKNAEKYFSDNVRDSNDFKDLKKIMNKNRGFVRVPFCSVDFDGEDCADTLKAETNGGNVCGTLFPKAEKVGPKEKCIICGKKAHHKVYVAKSY